MIKEPTVNSAEHKTIDRMVNFRNMFLNALYNSLEYFFFFQTSIFTRFAATGNPNCDHTKLCNWKPLAYRSTPPFKCLNIDNELSFTFYPEAKRVALWDSMQP